MFINIYLLNNLNIYGAQYVDVTSEFRWISDFQMS